MSTVDARVRRLLSCCQECLRGSGVKAPQRGKASWSTELAGEADAGAAIKETACSLLFLLSGASAVTLREQTATAPRK